MQVLLLTDVYILCVVAG